MSIALSKLNPGVAEDQLSVSWTLAANNTEANAKIDFVARGRSVIQNGNVRKDVTIVQLQTL